MDSYGGIMIEGALELGTKIYYVKEDNKVFGRRKIHKVDENGVEWFRYNEPLRTHHMEENTIVGRVLKEVEGRVPSIEDHLDEYFLEDGTSIGPNEIDEADAWSGYFLDKEEALKWIEDKKEEMHRIEHS
jgi:hypothetical protein